jgi:RimJ/RimL family protein N-acetyltransferase
VKQILLGADDRVGTWVLEQLGAVWTPGRGVGFGLLEDEKLIAGVLFDSWNGASVNMHVAAVPGKRWMTKSFLAIVFDYAFNQLRVKKIIGLVGADNLPAQQFDLHIGFSLEATLSNAHPSGDLLLYTMERSQCKWLKLAEKEPWHGKTIRTPST